MVRLPSSPLSLFCDLTVTQRKENKMHVIKIQISNILGIKRMEYEPGKFTTIEGENGSGKSSFLGAIQGAIGKGHNAKLLREGTDEGEVVLIFDNGETIHKKITADKSTLTVTDKAGRKIAMGASAVNDWVDRLAVNPIQLLTAEPKKRIALLLDSLPMDPIHEEIKLLTGLDRSKDEGHPIQILADVEKQIFKDRAELKIGLKKQEAVVEKMFGALSFSADKYDWAAEVGTQRTALEEQNKLLADEKQRTDELYKTCQKEINESKQKIIEDANCRAENELKMLNEQLREKDFKLMEKFNAILDPIKAAIKEADIKSKAQFKEQGAQKFIDEEREAIKLTTEEVETYSSQLSAIQRFKGELMENLPFPGLEVKDGDIYIDGIHFDTINTAERIKFALKVAQLRDSELKVCCVDGLEALDEETFNIFREEADKTKLQFFVTRVTDDEELKLK